MGVSMGIMQDGWENGSSCAWRSTILNNRLAPSKRGSRIGPQRGPMEDVVALIDARSAKVSGETLVG